MRVRVAVAWLGLFFVCAGCAKSSPEQAAIEADVRYGTGGFMWLATHDPSRLVAWDVPTSTLLAVAPDSRAERAESRPCAQAAGAHAALVVLVPRGAAGAHRRDLALDCGVALYRDERLLVIAPR